VRPKKRSALIKPSLLLEATSHTAMGVAVGLAFAFLVTHIAAFGIATLINYSPTPDVIMLNVRGHMRDNLWYRSDPDGVSNHVD
jgi:hypothetical protein